MEQQESSSGLLIGAIIGGTLLAFVVVAGVLGYSLVSLRSNAPELPPEAVETRHDPAVPEAAHPPIADKAPEPAPRNDAPAANGPPLSPAAVKDDLQKLQGNWTLISLEVNGESNLRKGDTQQLSFKGESWSWKRRGPWPLRKTFFETITIGTVRFVDVSGPAKALDLLTRQETTKIDDPPPGVINPKVTESDTIIVVIYGIDEDKLRLCYGSGARRPNELGTRDGDGFTYTVWKRDAAKLTPTKDNSGTTNKVK